jgi:hypothetical protein
VKQQWIHAGVPMARRGMLHEGTPPRPCRHSGPAGAWPPQQGEPCTGKPHLPEAAWSSQQPPPRHAYRRAQTWEYKY